MAEKQHLYTVTTLWTGNTGAGTASYRGYERAHEISALGKDSIAGSSDPSFRGDPGRWNPEELLVASLSACHQLRYLGLCAQAGVTVASYEDRAEGCMIEEADGGGHFSAVTLRPQVRISANSDEAEALALHREAHAKCFIARSGDFPVTVEPTIMRGGGGAL